MDEPMTGEELRAIRLKLGLSRAAFGIALGYSGRPQNVNSLIHAMESGSKNIMPWTARLATMYARYGVPHDWLLRVSWAEKD